MTINCKKFYTKAFSEGMNDLIWTTNEFSKHYKFLLLVYAMINYMLLSAFSLSYCEDLVSGENSGQHWSL
jgi:hypothetical protein